MTQRLYGPSYPLVPPLRANVLPRNAKLVPPEGASFLPFALVTNDSGDVGTIPPLDHFQPPPLENRSVASRGTVNCSAASIPPTISQQSGAMLLNELNQRRGIKFIASSQLGQGRTGGSGYQGRIQQPVHVIPPREQDFSIMANHGSVDPIAGLPVWSPVEDAQCVDITRWNGGPVFRPISNRFTAQWSNKENPQFKYNPPSTNSNSGKSALLDTSVNNYLWTQSRNLQRAIGTNQ